MGLRGRLVLALALFWDPGGAVHVHLAPAQGSAADTLAASENAELRRKRFKRQLPGLLKDRHTLEALFYAEGPVHIPPTVSLGGADLRSWERQLVAPAPVQLFEKVPTAERNVHKSDQLPTAEDIIVGLFNGTRDDADSVGPQVPTANVVAGSWSDIIIRMAIVLACAAVVFATFSVYSEAIERRFYMKVEHVCCAAYAALSISIDLSIKNAARVNGGHYSFNPACAVVTVEVLKLIASVFLFGVNVRGKWKEGAEVVLPGVVDVFWLMVPGFVYTCNNIIVFEAIGRCPLGAFGVIRETMLIWNAILWTLIFQSPIGKVRWFAIVLLFVGCIVNQLPAFFRAEFTWGVLWAFLLAFSNAAGGCANEYAMKRKAAMDINLQNCILYFFCGSFGMIYLLIFSMDDLKDGFFDGFSPQCIQVVILQMLTGLAVSRILKYVDAVTKTIVAALRGPGVIFFGAWIFHTVLHVSEVIATLVVCLACYIYLREGALVKPQEQLASAKAK